MCWQASGVFRGQRAASAMLVSTELLRQVLRKTGLKECVEYSCCLPWVHVDAGVCVDASDCLPELLCNKCVYCCRCVGVLSAVWCRWCAGRL